MVTGMDHQPEENSIVDPGEEPVDLVDEKNRIIGWARRREVRARNLLHRGVGIICINSRGQVYVHRRTGIKDIFPGMYDMFVGGMVNRGEAYREAALREVREELGIEGPEPDFLFTHLYQGEKNRAWIQVYQVQWNGAIRHQPEEIAWGKWMEEEQMYAMIREKPFVPDGLEIFETYQKWREGIRDSQALPRLP